jgi:hypothetical protein
LHGAYNLKEEKGGFIAECEYKSMQSPTAVYDLKYNLVTPNSMKLKMYPAKKIDEVAEKKKIGDLPSPGQYDIENSFKNT